MEERDITNIDWIKHYFASLLIYGVILVFLILCPVYYETISYDKFDYTAFFVAYYALYMIIAPIVFYFVKPKSVLTSRSLTILRYIKRQFKFGRNAEEYLNDFNMSEQEKLSFMTLFIQTFFGVFCVNTLCNVYIADLGYNIDFIKALFSDASRYLSLGADIWSAMGQFIVDTGDVWIKLIMMLTLIVLTFSYLSESDILKNRIKTVDTTPLGVLSCLVFYYPVVKITEMFIGLPDVKVENTVLHAIVLLLAIIANLGILVSVISLGTKSGNLTNRGIVTHFPYNVVRHPDYAMQIVYILATTIPIYAMYEISGIIKFLLTFTIITWIFFYYLRAVTEERHLMKDPEYREYAQKVKYRFIPKLF